MATQTITSLPFQTNVITYNPTDVPYVGNNITQNTAENMKFVNGSGTSQASGSYAITILSGPNTDASQLSATSVNVQTTEALSGSFNFTPTASGTYVLRFTRNTFLNLGYRFDVSVVVSSSVTTPNVTIDASAATGAVGNTVTLTTTNTGGTPTSYTWEETSGAGTLTGNNASASYVWPDNIGGSRTAVIKVTATNSAGSSVDDITITQNAIDTVLTGAQTVTFDDNDDTVSFTLGSLEVGTQLRILRNPASGDSLVGATTITSTSQTFTTKNLQTGNNGGAFDPTEDGDTQLYTPQVRVNSSDAWVSTTGGNITLSKLAGPKVVITIKSTYFEDNEDPDFPIITQSLTATASPSTFGKGSSSNPIIVSAGDLIEFVWDTTSTDATNATLSNFGSEWTNTNSVTVSSSVDQQKTWATGVTPGDSFNINVNSNGSNSLVTPVYFEQSAIDPDLTVTFPDAVKVAADADEFSITVTEASPNSNSSVTVYQITSTPNGNDISGNTTKGPTTLTVSAGPPNASNTKVKYTGEAYTYFLKAFVGTGDGGDGDLEDIGSFTVTWGDTPGSNPPVMDAYGLGIWDDEGNFVTSFTSGYTVMRKIFFQSGVTLSTSGTTTVNLGLSSNISDSNCVAMIRGTPGESAITQYAYNFDSNGDLVIGRTPNAANVDVTILQHKGDTETTDTSPSYGLKIENGDGDVVIDELAQCYAVREIINVGDNSAGTTNAEGGVFHTITLTNGRYPYDEAPPIPAINSSGSGDVLVPPVLRATFQTMNGDQFYQTVVVFVPNGSDADDYNLAMLVEADATNPVFYGGSEPSYGFEIRDSSQNVVFHSGWRQAIINNVINANVFGSGEGEAANVGNSGDDDFGYNVVNGFDGVTEPVAESTGTSELTFSLESTSSAKQISNLNAMDPQNSYLLGGNIVSGRVRYFRGDHIVEGAVESENIGGGEHLPSLSINSNTTVLVRMLRVAAGPNPDIEGDGDSSRCKRTDDSFHPEGSFVIARIT